MLQRNSFHKTLQGSLDQHRKISSLYVKIADQ